MNERYKLYNNQSEGLKLMLSVSQCDDNATERGRVVSCSGTSAEYTRKKVER
jgi:hypothetical protein